MIGSEKRAVLLWLARKCRKNNTDTMRFARGHCDTDATVESTLEAAKSPLGISVWHQVDAMTSVLVQTSPLDRDWHITIR